MTETTMTIITETGTGLVSAESYASVAAADVHCAAMVEATGLFMSSENRQ